ncbi:hypothetical protein CWE09_13240 [Aliidiomarina minuta]|uniref:Membrane protein FxsA n=1 Tax=Aliidiomarina minuta TaxID=880057 RepID=A0A432W452_9GAMM|nr:FxsA family protein [Aliidiomarina minuta]RUO24102.1 hypothetical protein CWE09_13240 [Aliidiomarina minuta]
MFRILLLLFIVLPIIEIAVLLQIGSWLGGWTTLFLIILTAVAGASLVRQQGMQNWMRAQQRMASGEMPGIEMANGILIFVAGIVLITPGFVTDAVGLLLLLPVTRAPIARALMKKLLVRGGQPGAGGFAHFQFQQRRQSGQQSPFGRQPGQQDKDGTVIDGEYERKHETNSQLSDKDDEK